MFRTVPPQLGLENIRYVMNTCIRLWKVMLVWGGPLPQIKIGSEGLVGSLLF